MQQAALPLVLWLVLGSVLDLPPWKRKEAANAIFFRRPASIPRALAMTDAREMHGGAVPLEHGVLWLSFCSSRDSLSFAVESFANESHKVALRHSDIARTTM